MGPFRVQGLGFAEFIGAGFRLLLRKFSEVGSVVRAAIKLSTNKGALLCFLLLLNGDGECRGRAP